MKIPFIILFIVIQVNCEKIIIIGAGAAGLAAATRLIENNVTDFLIIEAEPRLGGRIHSIHIVDGQNSGNVDLGAEYVGGETGNAVYEIAKNDLKKTDFSKKSKGFYYNGNEIDEELCYEVLTFKENLRKEFDGKPPISAHDAFLEKYNSTILKKYQNNEKTLEQVRDLIEISKKSYLYRQGAFDWSDILLNDHYKVCEGDQGLTWNGKGYKHFLNILMRKFGDQHRLELFPIVYSQTVEKITWKKRGDDNILIETKSGRKYESKHVIFTPSLGVFRKNYNELFHPPIPPNKFEAMISLGFGGAMKVILQYKQKWWDDDVSSFLFVWKEEDEISPKNFSKTEKDKSWLKSFYRLFTVNGVPNVLIGWFVGPKVPKIEKMNISDIKDGVSYVIKEFLGKKYNVSDPFLVIPSSWCTNPHFLGVYSYETLEGANRTKQYQEEFAEPLFENDIPKVLFAGEHTHKTHFSTVHGAVESGYRASEELLKYMRNK